MITVHMFDIDLNRKAQPFRLQFKKNKLYLLGRWQLINKKCIQINLPNKIKIDPTVIKKIEIGYNSSLTL